MLETESKIERALNLIVDHCSAMVRGKAEDSSSHRYGAAVDLFSGGCLFVPGIFDSHVVTRVTQFLALSKDCIAAWTANTPDIYTSDENLTVHCRWRGMQADINVPLSTPFIKISLPSVDWEVCRVNNIEGDNISQPPYTTSMRNFNAEKEVRNHLELHDSLALGRHGERSHGCFIDRENRDMFIDDFLGGSFQPPGDANSVRQRLETFSYGRHAVTFGIAKYSVGALSEIQVWRTKTSVFDSVRGWFDRSRFKLVKSGRNPMSECSPQQCRSG